MSKIEGKMILVSYDDSVDRKVKASLRAFDAILGCIGTTDILAKLRSIHFNLIEDMLLI